MVSAWWLLWVFLAGGYTGFLLLALLRMGDSEADGAHEALRVHRALAWQHRGERRGYVGPAD